MNKKRIRNRGLQGSNSGPEVPHSQASTCDAHEMLTRITQTGALNPKPQNPQNPQNPQKPQNPKNPKNPKNPTRCLFLREGKGFLQRTSRGVHPEHQKDLLRLRVEDALGV